MEQSTYSTNNKVEMLDVLNLKTTKDEVENELLKMGNINTVESRLTNIERYFDVLVSTISRGDKMRYEFNACSIKLVLDTNKKDEIRHNHLTKELKRMNGEYARLTIELDAEMNDPIMHPPPAPAPVRPHLFRRSVPSTVMYTITVEMLIMIMVLVTVATAHFTSCICSVYK
jgi:hypothetical protein